MVGVLALIQANSNGKTLNYFHEITCSVLGPEEACDSARRTRHIFHVAVKSPAVSVDVNVVELAEGEEFFAGLNALADLERRRSRPNENSSR